MNTLKLQPLQDSLTEILFALEFNDVKSDLNIIPKSAEELGLFATSKENIYSSCTWMGRGVQWINRIKCRYIRTPSYTLESSLRNVTNTLFNDAVEKMYWMRQVRIFEEIRVINLSCCTQIDKDKRATHLKAVYERYQKKISKEFPNFPLQDQFDSYLEKKTQLSEKQKAIIRHSSVSFQCATNIFWVHFLNEEKYQQFFCSYLEKNAYLPHLHYYTLMRKEGIWNEFEHLTQMAIPVYLLAKIDNFETFNPSEKNLLKKWVARINQSRVYLSVDAFLIVLKQVHTLFKIEGSSGVDFIAIVNWLCQEECQLINENDELQMNWRENLCYGSAINCNSKPFIIGDQLGDERLTNDQYKYFELLDHPQWVVEIPNNPFGSFIRHAPHTPDMHWGVNLVDIVESIEPDPLKEKISGMDKWGRCAIVNKLTQLMHYQWISTHWKLTEQDRALAHSLANHNFNMMQHGYQCDLLLKNLGRDHLGRLKAIKKLKKKLQDFNDLEKMCLMNSQNNIFVLEYLIRVSRIDQHEVANFYRKEVRETLEMMKDKMRTHLLSQENEKLYYYTHADHLKLTALNLLNECVERASNEFKIYNKIKLEKLKLKVAKKILEVYLDWPLASSFPPQCVEKALEHLKDNTVYDEDRVKKTYYESEFDLMIEYNHYVMNQSLARASD